MDFFDMLIQYEKNFEKKITDNLNIFKREIINYSNIKYNDINFDNIEEKNIKEIIKEISSSEILHKLLYSKYKISNNVHKYTIFAKDIKKKENNNYNNQKDINLNNIIEIPIFKNNLIEEIKKTIFNNIKKKYLLDLNELLTLKKNNSKNNLKIVINENEENSLISNLVPNNNQLYVPIPKKIILNEKKIIPNNKNKTFRNEMNNFGISKDNTQNFNFKNIRMKRNKNKDIFLNNNKSSLISFLKENGGLEKIKNNNHNNNNNNNIDKTYVKNIHLNKKKSGTSEKSFSIDKKVLHRIESQGKITINKLKIKDLKKKINQNNSPKKIQDKSIKQPINNIFERNNNLSIKLKGKRNLSSKTLIKNNYNIEKDKN